MTVASELRLRVHVEDVWDTVEINAIPDWTIKLVKEEALDRATNGTADPSEYGVKFRGALVLDETRSLADLNVPDRAALIVLATRRRPVR